MLINQWAEKYGIPREALDELRAALIGESMPHLAPTPQKGASEAAVQANIRLEASRKGCMLWRNNVGASYTEDGLFIRYGLANDSHQMNRVIKSSDLIGIRPVLITADMVGRTIGQFVAREVKADGWKHRKNDTHEQAQLKFLELVASMGGDAQFACGVGTL